MHFDIEVYCRKGGKCWLASKVLAVNRWQPSLTVAEIDGNVNVNVLMLMC